MKNPLKAIGEFLLNKFKQAATAVKDYVADVITGKKLAQGLNDGGKFFDGWIAHGGSEIYNVMWKGEVAPMYAHSPPEPLQDNQPHVVQATAMPPSQAQQDINVANELMEAVKKQAYAQNKAFQQVDHMELGHIQTPDLPNNISLDDVQIQPATQQADQISMDGVQTEVSQEQSNQISIDNMQIDQGNIMHSDPISPEQHQETQMEM